MCVCLQVSRANFEDCMLSLLVSAKLTGYVKFLHVKCDLFLAGSHVYLFAAGTAVSPESLMGALPVFCLQSAATMDDTSSFPRLTLVFAYANKNTTLIVEHPDQKTATESQLREFKESLQKMKEWLRVMSLLTATQQAAAKPPSTRPPPPPTLKSGGTATKSTAAATAAFGTLPPDALRGAGSGQPGSVLARSDSEFFAMPKRSIVRAGSHL